MTRNIGLSAAFVVLFGLYVWWYTATITPVVKVPSPTMPTPNAFDDFNAAAALVADQSVFDGQGVYSASPALTPAIGASYSLGTVTLPQANQIVKDNAPAIARLRVGLREAYVAPPARSFTTLFQYYAKDRQMTRLLKFEGRAQALNGQWSDAAMDDTDAMQVGNQIPHGAPLIGALVGYFCSAIGRRDLWDISDHLQAPDAAKIANRLQQIQQTRLPFADTIQEEKWTDQASLIQVFGMSNGLAALNGSPSTPSSPQVGQAIMGQLFYMAYPKRMIMTHFTAYMDAAIAKWRKPYYDAFRIPDPPAPNDPYSKVMFFTEYPGVAFKYAADDANTELLMTVLALRAYKLDHAGAYPDSLDGLVPKYLQAVPYDPFAKGLAPLKYRLMGSSYLLYSIGPDGIDDGGKPFLNIAIKPPTTRWEDADTKGDIVAGVNKG